MRIIFLFLCFFFSLLSHHAGASENADDPKALMARAETLARESDELIQKALLLANESKSLMARVKSLHPSGGIPPEAKIEFPSVKEKEASEEIRKELEQGEIRREADRAKRALAVGGVLLPKGHLEVEPAFTYGSFSNNNLSVDGFALLPVFVVGQIQSEKVRRDILIPSLGLSYGVFDWLQIEAESPLRYRKDRITYSDNREKEAEKMGWGDFRLGTSVQIVRNQSGFFGFLPDTVLNASLFVPSGNDPFDYDPANPRDEDIPLGSGVWGMGGGLTMIKASDPAVLFWGLNGNYAFQRNVEGALMSGRFEPGETVGYVAGIALALNYKLTLSFQVPHTFGFKSRIRGLDLNDSSLNDARLVIGASWAYGNSRSLQFSFAAGLTEDAPDLLARVSTPFEFGLIESIKDLAGQLH